MDLNQALLRAKEICKSDGVKLTEKRSNVLAVLLEATVPLSAYELSDAYREKYAESIPPMSIYRMLDVLVAESIVHKMSSTNKYVACSHITCDHRHGTPQFLICKECHQVREIFVPNDILVALSEAVALKGCVLETTQLEMNGVCEKCAQ